jgi:hypothetical protein
MNEDNLKIKVEGFSRMPEGDKKNKVVEQITPTLYSSRTSPDTIIPPTTLLT